MWTYCSPGFSSRICYPFSHPPGRAHPPELVITFITWVRISAPGTLMHTTSNPPVLSVLTLASETSACLKECPTNFISSREFYGPTCPPFLCCSKFPLALFWGMSVRPAHGFANPTWSSNAGRPPKPPSTRSLDRLQDVAPCVLSKHALYLLESRCPCDRIVLHGFPNLLVHDLLAAVSSVQLFFCVCAHH